MRDAEQRAAAKNFAEYWKDKGYEKGESQPFWISLLSEVFGIKNTKEYISFENRVQLDHTSFIDGYIPSTKVMIEQKGKDKDLLKPIRQSDGSLLTPFQQAKRYASELPYSERPRWIIVCNFKQFLIYDMERPNGEPENIMLCDLPKEYYRLQFLVDTDDANTGKEEAVSVEAGKLVGILYDEILKQYINPENEDTLKSLNRLCVRLVFCLYAEDAGIFGGHNKFHNYIQAYSAKDMRRALIDLFKILDTKIEDRDPYLDEKLLAFPYVNGGLFADEDIEIPNFTDEIRNILLDNASGDFDWSAISPTIFGAVFESTLNPETRRTGGMHYTSIKNIHKVIDPLFLDELNEELEEIKDIKVEKTRVNKAKEFQEKLSQLTFLDPACGSGNFLTETYISLRRLENEALKIIQGDFISMGEVFDPIKVSIGQFYGIEINDFAVTVAKTALWIAESQMMKETEDIVHMSLDFLPLKSYANIVEGNALRMDWKDVIPKENLDYIMGNPPFVGYSLQSPEQKQDILSIYVDEKGKPYKTAGKIDYVSGWYFKAAEMMRNLPLLCKGRCQTERFDGGVVNTDTSPPSANADSSLYTREPNIKTAFVSTNSICQGEQVAGVWKPLYERFGIQIDFAHRTFRWDSEASIKAHVHCVIVGFSCHGTPEKASQVQGEVGLQSKLGGVVRGEKTIPQSRQAVAAPFTQGSRCRPKFIYTDDRPIKAENINPYLIDAPDVFIESRKKPVSDVPEIIKGSSPVDGGNLLFDNAEYEEFINREPKAKEYIFPFLGAKEYLHNIKRWCLWIENISPFELKALPCVKERIKKVREFRLASTKQATRKYADYPTRFMELRQPKSDYILIPRHSSENRKYIPFGFMGCEIICGDANNMLPDATLYHFGVLTSNVHMAWMRAVCGRLKSDYRYSNDVVYNNFPWCNPTDEQKKKIEATAQMILDARALYPDCSLADLYDEVAMPPELRKAHQENDKAVMKAYGFDVKTMTESDCVAELMKMYRELIYTAPL